LTSITSSPQVRWTAGKDWRTLTSASRNCVLGALFAARWERGPWVQTF
jgi:hypothetical protein